MSKQAKLTGQTLGLAGVIQAAYLVDQIARTGSYPAESFNPSINSLFQFDAKTPEAIFGGIHGLVLGLRAINDVFSGQTGNEYRAITRYCLGILFLEKRLSANQEVMDIIHSRLQHVAVKAEHFTDNPQSVASSVAGIYQDTLSTFKFRIQVSGSVQQLQNPNNADNIRALLLAGIRAAVLWRQMGGRRWHLALKRGQLQREARALLER